MLSVPQQEKTDGKDLESLRSHLLRNFAENCGRFWDVYVCVFKPMESATNSYSVADCNTGSMVAMLRGKGIHVNQPPETWEARGTHDKKAPQRRQNLLRPRRCFWVTQKVRTKCLFFVTSHREVTLSRLHFCNYIVTVFTTCPKWLLLCWCVWKGVVITIHSLKSTKKIHPSTEFNLKKIVLTFKSSWKLTWRSWWSGWCTP